MFKLEVARGLIAEGFAVRPPPPRGRGVGAKSVNVDARYDRVGHFPLNIDTKVAQRCKYEGCLRKTKYSCRKCKVCLSIDHKSDCFIKFHDRENE